MPIVICLTRRDNCLNEASRFSHIQLYFDGIEFFIHDNTFSIIVRELDRFSDYLKKHLLMIVHIAGPFSYILMVLSSLFMTILLALSLES